MPKKKLTKKETATPKSVTKSKMIKFGTYLVLLLTDRNLFKKI